MHNDSYSCYLVTN